MATRHSHSYAEHKADLLKRLRRMEGQVRGLQQMVEDDRYCLDIVQQTQALAAAYAATRVSPWRSTSSGHRRCSRDRRSRSLPGSQDPSSIIRSRHSPPSGVVCGRALAVKRMA